MILNNEDVSRRIDVHLAHVRSLSESIQTKVLEYSSAKSRGIQVWPSLISLLDEISELEAKVHEKVEALWNLVVDVEGEE